jgi:hypothetical protein
MDSGFFWRVILKRVLLLAAFFAVAFAGVPGRVYAEDAEEERFSIDAQLSGVLALLEIEFGIEDVMRKGMISEYEKNYKFDHNSLETKYRIDPAMNAYAAADETPDGYRYDGASRKDIYSAIYKTRRQESYALLEKILKANAEEGLLNMDCASASGAQKFINAARDASVNADGYMRMMEAATQESNLMNMEILQLRADGLRALDIQAAAVNSDMQDDADETSAFEQAVKTWVNPGASQNY